MRYLSLLVFLVVATSSCNVFKEKIEYSYLLQVDYSGADSIAIKNKIVGLLKGRLEKIADEPEVTLQGPHIAVKLKTAEEKVLIEKLITIKGETGIYETYNTEAVMPYLENANKNLKFLIADHPELKYKADSTTPEMDSLRAPYPLYNVLMPNLGVDGRNFNNPMFALTKKMRWSR